MIVLTLQALFFALLARAEATNSTSNPLLLSRQTQSSPLPGNLGALCSNAYFKYPAGPGSDDKDDYVLHAVCSTIGTPEVEVELDLNKCIKNDNAQLAWGKEYITPLVTPPGQVLTSSVSGFTHGYCS